METWEIIGYTLFSAPLLRLALDDYRTTHVNLTDIGVLGAIGVGFSLASVYFTNNFTPLAHGALGFTTFLMVGRQLESDGHITQADTWVGAITMLMVWHNPTLYLIILAVIGSAYIAVKKEAAEYIPVFMLSYLAYLLIV